MLEAYNKNDGFNIDINDSDELRQYDFFFETDNLALDGKTDVEIINFIVDNHFNDLIM